MNKLIENDKTLKEIETSDSVLLINAESKTVNEIREKKDTEDPPTPSSSSLSPSSSSSPSSIEETSEIISNQIPDLITTNNESSIRVENVSRITNDDWERIGSNFDKSPTTTTATIDKSPEPQTDNVYPIENHPNEDDETLSISKYIQPQSDAPEIIFTSIDKSRTVAISYGAKKRRVSIINEPKDKDTSINEVTGLLHTLYQLIIVLFIYNDL